MQSCAGCMLAGVFFDARAPASQPETCLLSLWALIQSFFFFAAISRLGGGSAAAISGKAMTSRVYPPGPKNWLAPLGLTFRHMLRMKGDRYKFLCQLGRRYGEVSFFRIGPLPVYFFNEPGMLHEILVRKSASFRKLPQVMRPLRRGMGQVLLTSEGPAWQHRRLLLQGMFRAERMAGYAQTIAQCTQEMLAALPAVRPISIEHEMTLLTQRIMFRVLFGSEPPGNEQELAEAVRALSDVYYDDASDLIRLPAWLPTLRESRKRQSRAVLDAALSEIIERHAQGEVESELLTLLTTGLAQAGLATKDNQRLVRQEATSMLIAGYHTTSVALGWMWYLLAKHPAAQARIRAEALAALPASGPGLAANAAGLMRKLAYSEMAVKESLRIYPAAWQLFGREAIEEVEIGRYRLPRGSWALAAPVVLHRDARYFAEPMRFDPERFSPERIGEIDPHAYLPFGAGPHACIGKSLTMLEMTLIASLVLRDRDVALAPGQRPPRYEARVALRPRDDIRLVFRPHQPAAAWPAVSLPQEMAQPAARV